MGKTQNIKGDHLFLLMHKASKFVEAFDTKSIKNLGFSSISDFTVLEILLAKGPLPVNAIGQKLMLTSGSITTAIDRAQRNGYVTRERDPDDGRIVNVVLTEKGRAFITNTYETHASDLDRLFNVLNNEEKIEFARLMKKVGGTAEALAL